MSSAAVITGASSGIGRAVSILLAKKYNLLFICGRSEKELENTKREVEKAGGKGIEVVLDLNDKTSIAKAAEKVLSEKHSIQLLFNNAGVSQRSLAKDTSEEVTQQLMQVNFFGPVQLTKLLLSNIREAKGRIAVTSSIVGRFGFAYRSTYSAAKHALHGYFESLGIEEAKNVIFVQLFIIGRVQICKKMQLKVVIIFEILLLNSI